ncbi:NYN domain-containing protein [Nocardioides sp. ChNu-99]|uniref:NYN domain-containing protein n=1 Tax=Nocardioides sp. ChNu-99 TaxID=2839897 RepID=UPI002405839E|nr:NYN domain-containing protein [Nocardioides sp. ChNu-99]MDF9715140.1 NYN domain-containing protein [Nocardioides sp. ChNu-99]
MSEPRVALYLDFENLVASQYNAVHGKSAWIKDRVVHAAADDPTVAPRLEASRIDVDAIVDYAASLGVVAISRAYANWACPAFASYARDVTARALDLTQLFPLAGTKNGADIRLATDVFDDMMRHPDITHVLVAAGDSDYVAVAQKAKRLGRSVVGVGVAGSVGRYWEAACDEFTKYDALPGVERVVRPETPPAPAASAADQGADAAASGARAAAAARTETAPEERAKPIPYSKLFRNAMNLLARKSDDGKVRMSELKQVLVRMSPGFDEATLGHKTFSSWVRAQPGVATDAKNQQVWFKD